jgi:hypothetical protein
MTSNAVPLTSTTLLERLLPDPADQAAWAALLRFDPDESPSRPGPFFLDKPGPFVAQGGKDQEISPHEPQPSPCHLH